MKSDWKARFEQAVMAFYELKGLTKKIPASEWTPEYRELANLIHTLGREVFMSIPMIMRHSFVVLSHELREPRCVAGAAEQSDLDLLIPLDEFAQRLTATVNLRGRVPGCFDYRTGIQTEHLLRDLRVKIAIQAAEPIQGCCIRQATGPQDFDGRLPCFTLVHF
jgi:hypothetical protein